MPTKDDRTLKKGWTAALGYAEPIRFDHCSVDWAYARIADACSIWAVETINWSHPGQEGHFDETQVHRNIIYEYGLRNVILEGLKSGDTITNVWRVEDGSEEESMATAFLEYCRDATKFAYSDEEVKCMINEEGDSNDE